MAWLLADKREFGRLLSRRSFVFTWDEMLGDLRHGYLLPMFKELARKDVAWLSHLMDQIQLQTDIFPATERWLHRMRRSVDFPNCHIVFPARSTYFHEFLKADRLYSEEDEDDDDPTESESEMCEQNGKSR